MSETNRVALPPWVVRHDPEEAALEATAAALRRALSALESSTEAPSAAIALPDAEVEPAPGVLVVALDASALDEARAAGARVVACVPHLGLERDASFEGLEGVLAPHEALVPELVERGASRSRVRIVGPIGPEGFSPLEDRATARAEAGLDASRRVVVVRASALGDDLGPRLVQLALVREPTTWLFDVGIDPELSARLRRQVPGYGLDAWMFAEDEAPARYALADAVLGRFGGPETARAAAVGAALVALPPTGPEMRLALKLEEQGRVRVVDSVATLAVALDGALVEDALAAGRDALFAFDAAGAAERAAEEIRALISRSPAARPRPAGLPSGLERLSDPDDEARPARAGKGRDDVEAKVDDELAALRARLGLD